MNMMKREREDSTMSTKEKNETILKIKQHRAKLTGLEKQNTEHKGIIALASLGKADTNELLNQVIQQDYNGNEQKEQ